YCFGDIHNILLTQEIDQKTSDRDFRTYINENRENPELQLRKLQGTQIMMGFFVRFETWQLDLVNNHTNQHKDERKSEVRDLGRIGREHAMIRNQFENKVTTNDGRDGRPQGIERLREIQPAGCSRLRP